MGKLVDEADGKGLGGISRSTLVERLVKSKEALRAVMKHLGHPHVDGYKDANCAELEKQAYLAAKFWVDTWPKESRPDLLDVVLKAALEAPLDATEKHRIFGGVPLERDLADPVEAHLKEDGLTVEREVQAGDRCADLVGYGETGLIFSTRRCVAVERKKARLGPARLLDLGGLGIRAISWWRGQYLFIGGPICGHGGSRLFTWDGGAGEPKAVEGADFTGLNPEAFVTFEDKEEILVLSDDGSRLVDGVECKRLPETAKKRFRGVWLRLPGKK